MEFAKFILTVSVLGCLGCLLVVLRLLDVIHAFLRGSVGFVRVTLMRVGVTVFGVLAAHIHCLADRTIMPESA